MKLVIGLGNPTAEYKYSRHNIGFVCLDRWAARHGKSFSKEKHYDYLRVSDTVLMKPTTYMNRSGIALKDALQKWQISDTLVVYDDLELEPALIRIRRGGGDGGHNGMKSLFNIMPPDNLKRIRIGIGRDPEKDAADYVLEAMPETEWEKYEPTLRLAEKFIDTYIKYDFDEMLNDYSKWKKSYSEVKEPGIISPQEEINDQGL